MTSLSRQLDRLRVPQTSVHREKKGSVSFLYDFLEAKSIDSDTHFAIASTGLKSLIQLNPNIGQFEESLFNESSKSLDRGIQSAEDNQELNNEIKSYLFSVVSNYFLLNSTHKTIEWLIHRYGVNQYNVDILLVSALPYHETRLFARLLQTCSAPKEESSHWFWLKSVQTNGCPLPKSTLITHCISEPTFLRFICDNLIECLAVDPNNNTFLTFFVSTLINLTERTTKESIISIIVGIVIKGLKSKNILFKRASLCICGHICCRIKLEQMIVNKILKSMAKKFKPSISDEILLTLTIMDRFQHLEDLPSVLINGLSETSLIKFSEEYKIQNIFSLILKHLLKNYNQLEANEKLMTLLDKLSLSSETIDVCLQTISKLIESKSCEELPLEMFGKVISLLERRYPILFDASLSKMGSLSSIVPLLGGFRYSHLKDSKLPLIFGLTHLSRSVQKEAIDHLIENFDDLLEQKDDLTINAIKTLLSDTFSADSPEILIPIFGLKEKMFKLFSEEEMKDICNNLLFSCNMKEKSHEKIELEVKDEDKAWDQLKNSILATYCSIKPTNEETHLSIVYPFLLPTNESQLITFLIIINSFCAKESKILSKLKKKLKKVDKKSLNAETADSVVVRVSTEFAKYYIQNTDLIRKNNFIFSLQSIDYLKSSALSLIILERILVLSSDADIRERSANILIPLIEGLLNSEKVSKPKHSFNTFEKLINNLLKSIRKERINSSNIIHVINSLTKSIDLSIVSNSESNVWFWFKQFNSDNYINRLFLLLFNNCFDKNQNKSQAFRKAFEQFIRKMFFGFGYDFFSPLWVNDRSVLLQTRSLCVSSHLTENVLQFSSITVLSSLISLHSSQSISRESALVVVQQLNQYSSNSLLDHCLNYSESIKNDENAISYAISEWVSSYNKTDSTVKQWIDLLGDDNCPQALKSGIILLLNKCGNELLRQLLTKMKSYLIIISPNNSQMKTMECLLSIYKEPTVFENITDKMDISFNFFISCLKTKAYQKIVVNLIDKTVFDAICCRETKLNVLMQLLDLSVDHFDKTAHKKLRKLLKCGELVSTLFRKLVPLDECDDYSEPKPKRMFVNDSELSLESNNWKKLIVLLEIIQSKSNLTEIAVLVKTLFNYLQKTFIMDSKISIEYLRQLLLNSLMNCMNQSSEDMPFAQIESLIECLRESQQKETQKLALILISSIAHRYKKEILDYVILIFTFIGTNLLHCDDQYSIQIVFDTMEAILPILLTDTNETKDMVINVFINSLTDIPSHRRLILLHKLLQMLGESEHLTIIFMKVIERIYSKSKLEKDPFLSLIVALNSKCDINIQIISINQLMDVFAEEFTDGQRVDVITDKTFSENDRRLIAQCLAQLILRIVSSSEFTSAVNNSNWSQLSDSLSAFLHKIIVLSVKLNSSQNETSIKDNYRKRVRNLLHQILLQFNSLLPNEQLIELVLQLMKNDSILIQRNAFELMNEKLSKLDNQSLDLKQLTDLLSSMISMVPTADSVNQMKEQQIHNTQLSMITCKLLSKHIGSDDKLQKLNFDLLEKIISLINGMNAEISANLKASCILCMTQLMTSLGNKAIPLIPLIVPIVVNNFKLKDEVITISNITSILKLGQNYPQFLSPYLNQILIELLSTPEESPQIKTRLKSIENTFAKMIPKRVLLTSIDTIFCQISKISFDSLCRLMSLLKQTFENTNSKSDVNDIQKFVKNLMVKALDLRNSNRNTIDFKHLDELENCCNEAFSVFIPKLSEITFRPLFFKLYDTSIRERNGTLYYRMISFYKLMNVLSHKLKSLFCIFVGPSIVNNCSQILSLFHSDNESELSLNPEDSNLLIVSILWTLSNCFLYDTNGAFLDKERMQALAKPIINQLSNILGTDEHYNQRVDVLCLCTQYLIESNKDETIIKDFNYQMLLKTRDNSPQVRLAALRVLRRLILVSGEDYLPIIPETIPFISELTEDDSTGVEDLVKTVITDLEQILGEPITKYL